jgi:hypothetical protein
LYYVASLVDFIIAWREIARQKAEKRKKEALYRVLVGSDLNYLILRDLINSASRGIEIKVVTRDGATIEIRQKETVDGIQRPPKSEDY